MKKSDDEKKSLKSVLLKDIRIPFNIRVKAANLSSVLPSNFLYEKELFYSNLYMIVKKKLPVTEGLDTMKDYKLNRLDPFRISDSLTRVGIMNLLLALFINLFWLIYTPIFFLFYGKTSGILREKFLYVSYWSKKISMLISEGLSLDQAMEKCPGSFSILEVNYIKSGIKSGNLEYSLLELKNYFRNRQKQRKIFLAGIIYPTTLLIIFSLISTFILFKIIPKFQDIFSQLGMELPWMTQAFIHASNIIFNKTFIFVFFGLILYILIRKTNKILPVKYIIPVFGSLARLTFLHEILTLISIQLKGGIPLDESLETVSKIAKDNWQAKKIAQIKASVSKGISLSASLRNAAITYNNYKSGIVYFNDSENLPDYLLDMSEDIEKFVELRLSAISKYVEPTMHFVIALMIGFVVIAMYQPLLTVLPGIAK